MSKIIVALTSAILLSACVSAPESETPQANFKTQIRWTSYGIPHVKADDWAGMGYGFAYATATDGVCVVAHDVMTVNGDLSRFVGPENGNLQSDIFHRGLLTTDRLLAFSAEQSANEHEFSRGYTAGYNRYLRDHADDLPAACAGKPWVQEITQDDLVRLTMGVGIRYGLGWFQKSIASATPPGEPLADLEPGSVSLADNPLADNPMADNRYDFEIGIGSNAVALGRDVTESGRGVLFGNPHYPWRGSSRFHMIHTTIPGELDVMGVSLLTTNRVAIGFNKDIAWSHTVSTALRFTLYELQLNPENPMEYKYGDVYRPIVESGVDIDVVDEDGNTETRQQSIYLTHYGAVVMSQALPWNTEVAYAIRDVNVNNTRNMATYDALNVAESIDDIEAAISMQGVPWTNTIAADRHGTAYYADISVTPNVDAELLDRCRVTVKNLPARVVVLNGANPGCEWKNDSRSAVAGALPAQEMPRIRRNDYVTNSNDSYWLSNPDAPLEGYSPIIGPERTARTLRTRAGLNFVQQKLAEKEKLGPQDLQSIIYSQRNYAAEILLDDVLQLCEENGGPVALENTTVKMEITPACAALAGWDRHQGNDSRGAQVWTEFWRTARKIPDVYAVPFDVNNPVHTPTGIAIDNDEVAAAVRQALANAQITLQDAGIALDARWGDVQFAERKGERIAIPGGHGWAGMFGMIEADLQKDKGYTPIKHGNSFIQVISWDRDGNLDPRGMLTYSQSQEPESDHYDNLTRLYSDGRWIRFPFSEAEIQADSELLVLELIE
jgi:acyl-homoserine-lactone acylase